MAFAAHRTVGADPNAGDGFANRECGNRIDFFATERSFAQQNRSRAVKTTAARHAHQTQGHVRGTTKQIAEERPRVIRKRDQSFGLLVRVGAHTLWQIGRNAFRVRAALNLIPRSSYKERQRVQRLFENAVTACALFGAGRDCGGAVDCQTKRRIVCAAHRERGVRRWIPQRQRQELKRDRRDRGQSRIFFDRQTILNGRRSGLVCGDCAWQSNRDALRAAARFGKRFETRR